MKVSTDIFRGLCLIGAMFVSMICASLFYGCTVYKGAKVVEGTDLAVGMDIPGMDGIAQLNVLNYLSGFRLGLQKDAGMAMEYTVKERNTYFGVISTDTEKTIKADVAPAMIK